MHITLQSVPCIISPHTSLPSRRQPRGVPPSVSSEYIQMVRITCSMKNFIFICRYKAFYGCHKTLLLFSTAWYNEANFGRFGTAAAAPPRTKTITVCSCVRGGGTFPVSLSFSKPRAEAEETDYIAGKPRAMGWRRRERHHPRDPFPWACVLSLAPST